LKTEALVTKPTTNRFITSRLMMNKWLPINC
jgi:hypothetical protein